MVKVESAAGATRPTLAPDALGVGLRPVFYQDISPDGSSTNYFEIITENYLRPHSPPRRALHRIQANYPIVLHGVGLNLLGHEPLDDDYVESVAKLAESVDAPFVTDHLCWTRSGGITHHDLLPTPYVPDLIELAVARAAAVQAALGRPFGIENLSTYVAFKSSVMPEWEFYTRVIRDSGCFFMLDINNIYVSSENHGFDPRRYIEAIDFSRVLQVHLAGHTRQPDGTIVDTHDRPIVDAVWQLYRDAWMLGGPFPTLIEWDANIPPFQKVLDEVEHARQVRR